MLRGASSSPLPPKPPLDSSSAAQPSLGDLVGSDDEDEGLDAPEGKTVRRDIAAKDAREDSGKHLVPHDSWMEEVWDILTVGGPMCAAGVGRTLQMIGMQSILGNMSTQVLAATSVANIWTNVMETILQSGMGQVVAIASQAYGARNYRLVATWCHITFVYSTILAIPFTCLRWFTADVLVALGVGVEVAEMAGQFTFYAQSVLIFELWYHTFRTYFAAQTIVMPDAIINFIFVFVWYFFCFMGVNVLNGGIVGAALAQAAAWVLQFFVFVGVSFAMGYHKKTWYTPDAKEIFVLSRWKTLIAQVVPAGISGLLEQLQLQAIMLIAARISEPLAAAQTLVGTLSMMCFMFAFGASGGTGIRVARFLGEGRAQAAKFTAIAGCSLVVGCNAVWGLLAALLLPYYVRAASNDPLVWQEVDDARWMAGLAITSLGSFVVVANVIMKQGRPHIVGLCVPVWTWFVGIPVSYYMAPRYGLFGIWTGTTVGYGMALLCLLFFFVNSDWEAIAQQARIRAEAAKPVNKAAAAM